MGFFSKPKPVAAPKEKEPEKAAAKQRLLETEGGNEGAELNAKQGQSVRRIFGA